MRESSAPMRRPKLIAAGVVLTSLAVALAILVRSASGPSTTQLLSGRDSINLLRKAVASTSSTELLATRWNARTVLASATEGDTPVQALQRFFDGVDPNELRDNPALAAAASADFFATVFPNRNDRPPQFDLAEAAEKAYRTRLESTENAEGQDADGWSNPFTFAFVATLEAPATKGVTAFPIVAILSGPSQPGGLSLRWSSDGTRLVRSSSDGPAQLWSVRSGKTVGRTSRSQTESSVAISPDGSSLAAIALTTEDSQDGRLLVRQVDDGTERVVTTTDAPLGVWWSPDGLSLAVRSRAAVSIFDAATLALRTRWPFPEGGLVDPPLAVAWSPDATRLVYTTNLAGAVVRDVSSGAIGAEFKGEKPPTQRTPSQPARIERVGSLAWAADGTRIVSVSDGDGVIVWDATTGEPLAVRHGDGYFDAQWVTDDRVLVKARFTNRRFEWNVADDAWTPALAGFDFDAMAVTSDGRFVATSTPYYVVIRKLR